MDAAIRALAERYFQGIHLGDTALLRSAFHPQAALFGEVNGQFSHRTLESWLDAVASRKAPRDLGEPFAMKVLAVDVQGKVASVKADVPLLGARYIDFLSMIEVDGQWRIANKVFTHIGAA